MLTIGLTGGIASGKTCVANLFAEFGVPILDTDLIAREIVQPGSAALNAIINHFGPAIINNHSHLDRRQLRTLIFKDKRERLWLEKLVHPLIRASLKQQLNEIQALYCILVIPLLLEKQPAIEVNRVLVVDTSNELQRQRLQSRDKLMPNEIDAMLKSQLQREKRLAQADDIITNEFHHIAQLRHQVQALHLFYVELATKSSVHS